MLAVSTPVLDDGPAGNEARRVDLVGFDPRQAWRAVGLDLDAWPTGANAPIVLRGALLSTDDLAHDLATSPGEELDAQVPFRPSRPWLLLGTDVDHLPLRGPQDVNRCSRRHRPAAHGGLPLSSGPEGDEPLGHAAGGTRRARWLVLAATRRGEA